MFQNSLRKCVLFPLLCCSAAKPVFFGSIVFGFLCFGTLLAF